MKTLIVIFAVLISSASFAQTQNTVTKNDIETVRSYLKETHENNINRSVTPVYTQRSFAKILDSLKKKKISFTLSRVEYLGSEVNGKKLLSIRCNTQMHKNKVPFSIFKIVKTDRSFIFEEICGNADM